MAERLETTKVAAPDIDERTFPWQDRTLRVYIDNESLETAGYRVQRYPEIREAFKFYTSDRDDGWINNFSIEYVDDAEEADIHVNASPLPGCEHKSCGRVWYADTDTDDAPEYYVSGVITLDTALDSEKYSWHTAYWLAYMLGTDLTRDLPDDLEGGDRAGEWWRG